MNEIGMCSHERATRLMMAPVLLGGAILVRFNYPDELTSVGGYLAYGTLPDGTSVADSPLPDGMTDEQLVTLILRDSEKLRANSERYACLRQAYQDHLRYVERLRDAFPDLFAFAESKMVAAYLNACLKSAGCSSALAAWNELAELP